MKYDSTKYAQELSDLCELQSETGMSLDEVSARLWWSILAEPGDRVAGALVSQLGAVAAFECVVASCVDGEAIVANRVVTGHDLQLTPDELVAGFRRWSPRLDQQRFDQVVRSSLTLHLRLVTPDHPHWPHQLNDLGDHQPLSLWQRGNPGLSSLLGESSVSVVGARAATAYGEHATATLVGFVSGQDVAVVSGGAYGIDGTAHRSTLSVHGRTVAVLAGGLDRLYPSGHETLFRRISETGALISEVPVGTAPSKWRFLQRNRIIGALTNATLVVEAGRRSGSLNTAHHCAQLGRPVGAVPGPITSAASAGCHRLLREAVAECITSGSELLELISPETVGAQGETALSAHSESELRVLDALSRTTARDVRRITQLSGLDARAVQVALGTLELAGSVRQSEHGWTTQVS